MGIKILLPLLCLCLFVLSASTRPAFQAVSKFDASQLLSAKWYEIFYADNIIEELYACTRQLFSPLGNGKVLALNGFYIPGLNGAFDSLLTISKQIGQTGKIQFYDDNNNPTDQYVYILEFDPCYEWIVYGLDFEGDENDNVVLMTKAPQNLVGLQKAIEYSEYYGFNSHHLELQTSKCDYNNIFYQLKKLRKGL